jgi:hypothetical protein
MDDFSFAALPQGQAALDVSGLFMEDGWNWNTPAASSSPSPAAPKASRRLAAVEDPLDQDYVDEERKPKKAQTTAKRPAAAKVVNKETGKVMTFGEEDGGDEKLKHRRQQIATASRASRARRKRELDDLRDENRRLREERIQFLGKIGELQTKVSCSSVLFGIRAVRVFI